MTGVFLTHRRPPPTQTLQPPNMKDHYEEQAGATDQAFDLDYGVAQAFCSQIIPKAVLLFTGEALDNGMDFEPEDGEGDDNDDEGGDNEG